jgi:hypothetical protein
VRRRGVVGTILTGCGLLAYRWRAGDPRYPSLAGHWLLLFGLAAASADIAAVAAFERSKLKDPAYPLTPLLAQFIPNDLSYAPLGFHQAVGWSVGAMASFEFR